MLMDPLYLHVFYSSEGETQNVCDPDFTERNLAPSLAEGECEQKFAKPRQMRPLSSVAARLSFNVLIQTILWQSFSALPPQLQKH